MKQVKITIEIFEDSDSEKIWKKEFEQTMPALEIFQIIKNLQTQATFIKEANHEPRS